MTTLSPLGRWTVLVVAFLGWFGAGMLMSITQLVGRPAAVDLLGGADEEAVGRFFAWYQCAFLFGAAAGGLGFGWVGDRFGRARGMAASILTYSGMALLAYVSRTPSELLVVWFVAGSGMGGMWPNGVALVSEAWSGLSRPMVAGVIGTAANIGMFAVATLATVVPITAESWRWVLLVGASPLLLGVVSLLVVPESPRWREARTASAPTESVFRPPHLGVTLLGIALAVTPLIGGWGSANWMNPWADQAGSPALKAQVGQARALTGIVGSFLGGWLAAWLGRRTCYFVVSLGSLLAAQYIFTFLEPTDAGFLFWVGVLGFFSGVYFGWLPLFLPELFPTRVRATGAGVSFNFGRIVTAATIFATGALMHVFGGDYARIGQVTSLVFVVGMAAIWLAPDTTRRDLDAADRQG